MHCWMCFIRICWKWYELVEFVFIFVKASRILSGYQPSSKATVVQNVGRRSKQKQGTVFHDAIHFRVGGVKDFFVRSLRVPVCLDYRYLIKI